MDKSKLCAALNVTPYGAFQVTNLRLLDWGGTMIFECLFDPGPSGDLVRFRLILRDCRDIQWRVYAHLKPPDDQTLPTTQLVNIRLGDDNHRKPLNMLTDAFGITTSYGALKIEKI
jgi:hypothetical protein